MKERIQIKVDLKFYLYQILGVLIIWIGMTIFRDDLFEAGRLRVIIIPDIESVNIGRGIGYDVIEHVPPQEIHDISATKIREQMKAEGKL